MFFVEKRLGVFSGKVFRYPLCVIGIVAFGVGIVSGIEAKVQLTRKFWSRVGSLGAGHLKKTNRLLVIKEGAENRRSYLEAVRKESASKLRELTAREKISK